MLSMVDFPNTRTASTKMERHWRAFFDFPSCNPDDDDVKNAVTLELFGYIQSVSLLDSTTSKIYLDIPQPRCYQG